MESQEGKNSNLSDASSANDIQVLDLHYEQAVQKTAYFFRFRNNLGEIGFYRETKDFWVFSIGYWSSPYLIKSLFHLSPYLSGD